MPRLAALLILILSSVSARAEDLDRVGRPAEEVEITGPVARLKVELAGAKDNIKVVKLADGSVGFIVKRIGAGTDRLLTPAEFAGLYYDQRSHSSWWSLLFNITSPAGILWVALGLGAQLLFTGRMLVQWIASEKAQRSVVPEAFWWMSLIGGTMLLVYFIWRRDIVGIVGQAPGWIIYARNLFLIHRRKEANA